MNQPEPIRLPPVENGPRGGEADAGRMLQILWRGKWILLVVPLLGFACAKLWLRSQVELFLATAQVQVDAREPNVLKSGAGEAINKPRTVLKQQQGLLKSTTLLKRVAESPALAGMQTFAPERLGGQTVVGHLYECLQTSIDVESDRLFITFLSPYRAEAVTVVDEALRVYIEYHKEKKKEQAEVEAAIVRREWENATHELETATQEIAELQGRHALLAGTDRTQLQTRLDNANTALNAAHSATIDLAARYEEMKAAREDPARFRERGQVWRATRPVAVLEEEFGALEKQREEKEEELRRLQRVYGEAYPRLGELRGEIQALRAREDQVYQRYAEDYLLSAAVEYREAQRKEASLAADVGALLGQIGEENTVLHRINVLEIERDKLRERVAGFDERIAQLDVENQTGALNLTVIEYARAGVRPTYPETEKTLIYALGGSSILAFALVLLLGLSDRRVREVEDVPGLLGTSVLGVLPEVPHGSDRVKVARLVEEDPRSLVEEAIRSVRTAVAFALPDGGRGVIVMTSASTGEGKSVCASNLAFSLAKAGRRTLLVDADMHAPAQHEVYAVENGTGLAGLLASSAPVKKAIVANVALGLDLLPAGDPKGKAAELCAGPVLAELVRSLRETYECIVVDSPAVLETSEARVLAALADAVVFVLRLDESRAPNLKRAAGILRGVGARILGALPNGASSRRGARAYAGGISYEHGSAVTATRLRRVGDRGREGEAGPKQASARGTDFLGLEEESA
jgi:capsular exopolysaccharide synthesis family protein